MPWAMYASLVFTVLLMVTTAYFLMGGLPLLTLKHDVPLDARFVHSFFRVYYQAATLTAVGAAISYALWGRWGFALSAAAIAAVVRVLRARLLGAMQQLGAQIQASGPQAIRHFRQVHTVALLANALQLALVVWGLLRLSAQMARA